MQREYEKLTNRLKPVIDFSQNAREKFLALLMGQVGFQRANKEFSRVLIKMYVSELDKLTPEFVEWNKEYLDFLINILDEGKKRKEMIKGN